MVLASRMKFSSSGDFQPQMKKNLTNKRVQRRKKQTKEEIV